MFARGGWGIAHSVALLSLAAAALAGCAAASSPPVASTSTDAVAASPVPATAGVNQPRLSTFATPASLLGLPAKELVALLGAPKWTRRERPAQVWQYQGGACVLDVYLYEENGTASVVYAEARGEASQPVTLAHCLERIEAERRSPSPSS